jgi:DNA-binding NarL/FixJ family response regulator
MTTLAQLSPRETEVLQLFDRGFLYKDIADKLHISVGSVMEYRERIVLKSLVKAHRVSMRRVAWLRR